MVSTLSKEIVVKRKCLFDKLCGDSHTPCHLIICSFYRIWLRTRRGVSFVQGIAACVTLHRDRTSADAKQKATTCQNSTVHGAGVWKT
jgi:hypothetical protein